MSVSIIDPVTSLDPGRNMQSSIDSTAFIAMAEQVVVDNFNSHRKPDRSPELTTEGIDMVWYARGLIIYKAQFTSRLAKGLIWEVTYHRTKNEMYLDVYGKLNNVKIPVGVNAA